jgi:hypothetical protein
MWAQLLVDEFVESGLEPAWTSRLPALQQRWARAAFPRGEDADLPWYLQARAQQGAYATFLGMILQKDSTGCRWYALAVGDSCLFQVRGDRLLEAFPVARAADFGNAPWLVGSRNEPARIERHHGDVEPGDRFWLMTDALAAWFLRTAEAGGRPWRQLHELEQQPAVEAAFALWVAGLRRGRHLRDDDVTLMSVLV